jgi:Transposase DDE domain
MSWRAVDVERLIGEDHCQSCMRKSQCCPDKEKRGRSVARPEESAVVIAFRRKMATAEAQQRYRRRGRVVEFCHAWIKSKLGLRRSMCGA